MNKKNLELCPSPEIRGVNVLNGMPKNTEHTKWKYYDKLYNGADP